MRLKYWLVVIAGIFVLAVVLPRLGVLPHTEGTAGYLPSDEIGGSVNQTETSATGTTATGAPGTEIQKEGAGGTAEATEPAPPQKPETKPGQKAETPGASSPNTATDIAPKTPETPPQRENPATPAESPSASQATDTELEAVNRSSRDALVNILCTVHGNTFSSISGSGVMIDPRGVILTNAHIAQYFLLRDFRQKDFVSCVVRTGSPAIPTYTAEIMYVSPRWIEQNKSLLKGVEMKGTGENDFALLRVTGRTNGSALPATFPYVSPGIRENLAMGERVVLISYPADFLGGVSIVRDLNLSSALASIAEVFTFKQTTIDLISVPGTVLSQRGASGGAVLDSDGKLVGIITTASEASTTADRDLRAITLAHISRSIDEETGGTLPELLSFNPSRVTESFRDTATRLSTLLIKSLSE